VFTAAVASQGKADGQRNSKEGEENWCRTKFGRCDIIAGKGVLTSSWKRQEVNLT
jgi:hypothetical protein